jgi:hypothetical protein
VAIKKKPNIVEIAKLQKKYGNIYKNRNQVEVAIRKLLKERTQKLNRIDVAKAKLENVDKKQKLLEDRKKAKRAKSKRFDPYSIFYFTYKNPVSNPPIWDIRPLVIMLGLSKGKHGTLLLGVNMHWIDRSYRWTFWNYLRRSYEMLQSYNREAELPLLVYNDIKKFKALKPAMKAIRKYYITRIGKVVRVPESDYDKIFVKYKSLKKVRISDSPEITPTTPTKGEKTMATKKNTTDNKVINKNKKTIRNSKNSITSISRIPKKK